MSTYAQPSDVAARLQWLPDVSTGDFTSTSKPTKVQVQGWLDEAEAELNGQLQAAQLPAPYTDTTAKLILGRTVTDYAEGRVRKILAAAGGDGNNNDGVELIVSFLDNLKEIQKRPVWWGMRLGGGTTDDSARRLRGHVLDNADGLTIAKGDFKPVFKNDEVF